MISAEVKKISAESKYPPFLAFFLFFSKTVPPGSIFMKLSLKQAVGSSNYHSFQSEN